MKYWLLTTEFPPAFGGGIATYCFNWAAILVQHSVEVTVFVADPNENGVRESRLGQIRVIRFSPYFENTSAFFGYETMIAWSFAKVIEQYILAEGHPEWIESQEYNGIAYFVLQKKHLAIEPFTDLKILVTCHCPSFITFEHNHVSTYQLPYFWIGEMERSCIAGADVCIFPSQYLETEIERRYPSLIRERRVLANPFTVDDRPLPGNGVETDFLVIGKLSPAKGALLTIEAFDKLWQAGYQMQLKWIGDTGYFYHAAEMTMGEFITKKYSSHLRSGRLQLARARPPAELKREFANARTVLVPSTVENLPYVVIEAMANGNIVLAARQGGQAEMIEDGNNGLLFDHNHPGHLAEKILQATQLTSEQRVTMRQAATATVRRICNPEKYFQEKKRILDEHAGHDPSIFPFSWPAIPNVPAEPLENQLLSIVIPFYNMGAFLEETIRSIDESLYREKEIIIVNDGSTERASLSVLDRYRTRSDVRIIDQPNLGLALARNKGAREAKGAFLAFLDADDTVHSEYYLIAIRILTAKTNVHFAGSWVQYFGDSHHKWPTFTPQPPLLFYHNMVNSSGLVYKASAFNAAGRNDPEFVYGMEDYDSVISLLENGYRGVVIPGFYFNYRVRKNSMSRAFNTSNQQYLYDLLARKHRKFYATFAAELFGLLNANGPGIARDNPSLDYHLAAKVPFGGKLSGKAVQLVKQNELARKIALRLYRFFK